MRIKRRNGLVSALLGLVTCGLYHIFFWYQYGEDTNWVCRDDRKMTQNYIVAWILSWITCGIYGLYWTYQLASRLDQAGDPLQRAYRITGDLYDRDAYSVFIVLLCL